jgi:hypothetical protein
MGGLAGEFEIVKGRTQFEQRRALAPRQISLFTFYKK